MIVEAEGAGQVRKRRKKSGNPLGVFQPMKRFGREPLWLPKSRLRVTLSGRQRLNVRHVFGERE